MLATMRILTLLCLIAAAAPAGERDGSRAHPQRWTHPRGPASRSCVSQAQPMESLGDVVWTYRAQATIAAAPLTWDGMAFLREGGQLVAIDLDSGKRRATQKIGAVTAAALGEGAVFVRQGPNLVQWRRHNATFRQRWSIELTPTASAPCIHEGEIYVTSGGKLVRLRIGQKKPAWSQGTNCFGTPALLGEEIYSLERAADDKVALVARARLDGSERARIEWAKDSGDGDSKDGGAGEGSVAVNRDQAAVRIGEKWTLIQRKFSKGKVTLRTVWPVPLKEAPLLYTSAAIGYGGNKNSLMLYRYTTKKNLSRPLVTPAARPDLLTGAANPISMQDVMCTGLWMANLNANLIRWHLHERPQRKLLADGVAYRAVPATDERILLISKDKKRMICVAPEVIG